MQIEISAATLAELEHFRRTVLSSFGFDFSDEKVVQIALQMASMTWTMMRPEHPSFPAQTEPAAAFPKKLAVTKPSGAASSSKPTTKPSSTRTIPCACGCGGLITTPNTKGKEIRFRRGHRASRKAAGKTKSKATTERVSDERVVWGGGPLLTR